MPDSNISPADENDRLEYERRLKSEKESTPTEVKEPGDYEAYATKLADEKYEREAPGALESAALSFGTGGSLGFDKELSAKVAEMAYDRPFDETLATLEQREREGRERYPVSTTMTDVGGSIGTSLLPGAGIAKGAKLAPTMLKMGGLSALEGFGRTEGDIEQRAKGAATSGGIGTVLPGAGALVGKGLKKAKALLPGTTESPRFLNRWTSKASEMSGVSEDTARAYQQLLDSPERLKKAFMSSEDMVDEIPIANKELSDSLKTIENVVKEKYEDLQTRAFAKNVGFGNEKKFFDILDDSRRFVDEAFEEIASSRQDFYTPKTKLTLKRIKKILSLDDPKAKNLDEKLRNLKNKMKIAVESNDVNSVSLLAKEHEELLTQVGGALHRARMRTKEGINWAQRNFESDDEQLFLQLRDKIQKLTHEVSAGSDIMKDADKLYHNYKLHAEPFLNQFKGRGPGEISQSKAGKFISDEGSKYTRAQIKAYEKSAKKFLDEFGLDSSGIDKAVNNFSHFRDSLAISRLGGQTGHTTGRRLMPASISGLAGATVGFAGAGAGGAAATFLPLLVLLTPALSPKTYLSALNTTRKMIEKVGENKAAKIIGASWPAVKSALTRQIANDEDAAIAAEEIRNIMKSGQTNQADENNQKIKGWLNRIKPGQTNEFDGNNQGMVPQKIKDYFENRGNNSAPKIPGSDQGASRESIDNSGTLEALNEKIKIKPNESTLGGRIQAGMDELSFSDKIGLDPDEEPYASQPNEDDYAIMLPMFAGITKKITKLDLKLRQKLLEKKGESLTRIDKERIRILEDIEKDPELKERMIAKLNKLVERRKRNAAPKTLTERTDQNINKILSKKNNAPGASTKAIDIKDQILKGDIPFDLTSIGWRSSKKSKDPWKLKNGVLGEDVKTGNNDPFSWVDSRHGITKDFLKDNPHRIREIHTRSDLIGHSDYMDALPKDAVIKIHIAGTNSRAMNILEPGVANVSRRLKAAKQLIERGFKVNIQIDRFNNNSLNKLLRSDDLEVRKLLSDKGLSGKVGVEVNNINLDSETLNKLRKELGDL